MRFGVVLAGAAAAAGWLFWSGKLDGVLFAAGGVTANDGQSRVRV